MDCELNFKLGNPNGGRKGKLIVLIRMKLTCDIHTVNKDNWQDRIFYSQQLR